MKYRNPILSGFHPDPSICRAGEDFYLVTSTFEFYPGVPVYHSRNLVDWELLGYCMTEENEFNLEKAHHQVGFMHRLSAIVRVCSL